MADEPPNRIWLAQACLHVSTGLYVLLGIGCFLLPSWLPEVSAPGFYFIGVFSLGVSGGVEVVAWAIRRRKYWGWIAGLCGFGMYTPSLFLPLGVLGLWGLLDAGSQEVFRAVKKAGGKP